MEVSLHMQVSIESFLYGYQTVSDIVQEEASFSLLSFPINYHPNKSCKGER